MPPPLPLCVPNANTDGIINARLATFKCLECARAQPQRPEDFITHMRAWPATHENVSTIVDMRMLLDFHALKLCNPQLSQVGYLKASVAANAWPLKVGAMPHVPHQAVCCQCTLPHCVQ